MILISLKSRMRSSRVEFQVCQSELTEKVPEKLINIKKEPTTWDEITPS
jgi:hypothetical protein